LSVVDARLREFAKLSAELPPGSSSKLAVEPHVTLAHDPHDPLELLERFNAQYRSRAADPQRTINLREGADRSATDQVDAAAGLRTVEPQHDPSDMFSLLDAIPQKRR
jgi:hypothetical protein